MDKEQLRKMKNHLKFKNGGKVEQVGLHELPEHLLLGALLLLKKILDKPEGKAMAVRLGKASMVGQAARKKKAEQPPKVFVAFPEPPPETLRTRLKEIGLRFDPKKVEWRGPVTYAEMMRAVVAAGWDRYVLRS